MDIASLNAAERYAAFKPATEPKANTGAGFQTLAQDFAATLRAGEETATTAMTGGADPHALVQALAHRPNWRLKLRSRCATGGRGLPGNPAHAGLIDAG